MANFKQLFYQAVLLAWGDCPDPRATTEQLKWAMKIRLMEIYPDVPDPEVPDNLLSVMIPSLKLRGVEGEEISKVAKGMLLLGDPSTGGASSALLKDSMDKIENETVVENLGDVVGGLFELNPSKVVSGVSDTIGDFFSGKAGGLFGIF